MSPHQNFLLELRAEQLHKEPVSDQPTSFDDKSDLNEDMYDLATKGA